jgi:uncharacterized protein YbjT (DUF2867 family)
MGDEVARVYRLLVKSPAGLVRVSIVNAPAVTSSSFARSMVAVEQLIRSARVLRDGQARPWEFANRLSTA